jgi:archaeal type IV pilus assembly protein PilA
MKPQKSESAVSEVISVVLVVALTVILAAIVAAYMFGMVPSLPFLQVLAYTAEQPSGNKMNIVYHGGPNAGSLAYARVNVTESGGGNPTYLNSTGAASNIFGTKVGSTMIVTASSSSGFSQKDHVVVTAHFTNDQEQVVLDTWV